ncbi:class I SAM-dependent methyltransferase [Dyella psychrodurans]|uniref:Methyltransferase n=1 Tax=Dyella psychrodurans TaxID=1927960 RepID=A0A370X4M9_9GAMM|nr:class I SAM-dependent methyltransferase [Dyella psychrodurans]RDS83201.1 methyltransferase [Dyella psychrodurans]
MKIRLAFGLTAVLLLAGTAHAQQAGQDQPTGDLVPPTSASDFTANQLDAVLAGSWRSATNKARDVYRHPKATLQFFGLQPDQTVIEITPGAGWYAEVLAPLLRDNGHYIAAVADNNAESKQDAAALRTKFAGDSAEYGKASIVTFNPQSPMFGRAGSADMVLTFRNVHNWAMAGTAQAMFKAFFAVLKPGGVLGVVDHRAALGATLDSVKGSGYLPTDYIIKLATDAGFKLDAQSDINANPKDTKDYPKGVWTLPPTLALGDQDRAKYLAIGESDRMTLRFVKPAASSASPGSSSSAATH